MECHLVRLENCIFNIGIKLLSPVLTEGGLSLALPEVNYYGIVDQSLNSYVSPPPRPPRMYTRLLFGSVVVAN